MYLYVYTYVAMYCCTVKNQETYMGTLKINYEV